VRDDRRRGKIDPARSSSKSPKGIIGTNRWFPPQNADTVSNDVSHNHVLTKRERSNDDDFEPESAKKVRIETSE
jgi:hypothetical protein